MGTLQSQYQQLEITKQILEGELVQSGREIAMLQGQNSIQFRSRKLSHNKSDIIAHPYRESLTNQALAASQLKKTN